MDQTLQDWLNKEDPSTNPWMEQEDIQWKMIGQQRDKQHLTKNGQDQQTSKERPQFKDEFITEDIDEQQEARKAKGKPAPRQPTEQERMEH